MESFNGTTEPLFVENAAADALIGTLYLFCLFFGVPANLIALTYFLQQNKDLSTCLYLIITTMDIAIAASSSIIALNFYSDRSPLFFNIAWFCWTWRIVFKMLQRMSVFLVLVLSISRTILFVFPLKSLKKRKILGSIAGYFLYLIVETIILQRQEEIIYHRLDVYCFEALQNNRLVSVVNDFLHILSLAVPMIPIVCSCFISVHYVRKSPRSCSQYDMTLTLLKRRATVTVIIFTVVYLVFNIPLITNLVLWLITQRHYDGAWPGPFYGVNAFMYMYMWNLTDILFGGLNSTLNPVIYFMRFPNFQRWTKLKFKELYIKVFLPAPKMPKVAKFDVTRVHANSLSLQGRINDVVDCNIQTVTRQQTENASINSNDEFEGRADV